ncbi:tripartite tricarboxylate transporter substrate-binding protein [uncultured Xylophilus sp.]|uniref:Bug family tripartite tricarboxylate transporter substrate binding protein n=1 Tax=uncultured Xylophilus sp. TaxID=296832 RepID=UPI0025EE211D|nr:tripartite tricarboxylate transporter substrate-binding protein [uncultured Xylophilus sp.]
MTQMQRRTALALIGATAAATSPFAWAADEWAPTKVVRIVVPIVGSTNDTLARLVASKLQDVLGQPVIVDNKGGAGGNIGANEVAKAAPDGHTLLTGFNGPIAINKSLFKSMPYDPERDLAPITLAVSSPQFLVVHPSVPANNVKELIALSKKKHLSYGSVSVGSASHLTMEMLKTASGADITHVPYKGATQAVVDLVGGVVDAAFLVPGNILQFVQEGKAKVIATTGAKRFPSMPQVPTMIEQGYPGFIATSWIGFLAPGKTPPEIIRRYNKEMVKILQMPEIKAQLEKMEFEVVAGSPEQFAAWIKAEIPRWGAVIKSTGATVD